MTPGRFVDSLAGRIVSVFGGLLLVVQLAGFFAIRQSIGGNARAQLASQLEVGERLGELFLGTENACFNGTQRQIKSRGDFFIGEFVLIKKGN